MESQEGFGMVEKVGVSPLTEIVDLSDVNLDVLMEDMDTICSPSDVLISGCTESSCSYPNYLLNIKKHAQAIRSADINSTNSLKNCKLISSNGSDVDSTCGMVNIHYNSRINLCENPSDMWYGLKMSDGTPVVINSRRKTVKNNKFMRNVRNYNNIPRLINRIVQSPIDYSSGFLSISKYVARGSGATEIYTNKRNGRKDYYNHKFNKKSHRERVQQHLAKTRGLY